MKLLLFRNTVAKGHNTFEFTKSYIHILVQVNLYDTLSEGQLFWNMKLQYMNDPGIDWCNFSAKHLDIYGVKANHGHTVSLEYGQIWSNLSVRTQIWGRWQ